MGTVINPLSRDLIATHVNAALTEDLGLAGDITTNATIPKGAKAKASIGARKAGVIAGLAVAEAAFTLTDPDLTFISHVEDGDTVKAGTSVATIEGRARAILMAERVALNFLSHMSGIATATRVYVDEVAGTGAAIVDTRKTTPGLRAFEKYAVRAGGGENHRFGLFDAILIKDNHIAASGGIAEAIQAAKKTAGHMVKVEAEVDTLEQLKRAIEAAADVVMLDNMSPDQLVAAVQFVDKRAITEASGGVTLETVRAIAETGVDLISVGALTHSAPILDLGLDFEA